MIFFRFSLFVWSVSLQFARVLRNGSSVRDYGSYVYFFNIIHAVHFLTFLFLKTNKKHQSKYNKTDHKTYFISAANSYMFRHPDAIIREIINKKSGSEGEQRLNYGLDLRSYVVDKLSDECTLVQKQVGVGK
jgi:hypothetical protein